MKKITVINKKREPSKKINRNQSEILFNNNNGLASSTKHLTSSVIIRQSDPIMLNNQQDYIEKYIIADKKIKKMVFPNEKNDNVLTPSESFLKQNLEVK